MRRTATGGEFVAISQVCGCETGRLRNVQEVVGGFLRPLEHGAARLPREPTAVVTTRNSGRHLDKFALKRDDSSTHGHAQ